MLTTEPLSCWLWHGDQAETEGAADTKAGGLKGSHGLQRNRSSGLFAEQACDGPIINLKDASLDSCLRSGEAFQLPLPAALFIRGGVPQKSIHSSPDESV